MDLGCGASRVKGEFRFLVLTLLATLKFGFQRLGLRVVAERCKY